MMTLSFERFAHLLSTILIVDPSEIEPESLLVEEFGFQSIDAVELIALVEKESDQIPETVVVGDVKTVEDLYLALCSGADATQDVVTQAMEQWMPEDPMQLVTTLVELVERRALLDPDDVAVVFGEQTLCTGDLADQMNQAALTLQDAGVAPGDRVLIVMPNSLEFFGAFFGVQRAGAVSVPLFHMFQPERIVRIARHCEPTAIITFEPLGDKARAMIEENLPGQNIALLCAKDLFDTEVNAKLPTPPQPSSLAMLQYTSGTTGDPKGVMLTHQALLANLRQAIPTARFTREDVFVSWLPVYHDMGLITMTLCPLYVSAKLVLLPVRLSGEAWLGAIARHGGTITAAPDFAYRYALRTTPNLSAFDVKTLRMALIAAEPIRQETITQFERALGLRGVLRPGYGLAEMCVAVTFYPFEPEEVQADEYGNVACGLPVPGTELSVRNEAGEEVSTGEVGELCLRGPSQTLGYFRNQTATEALFTQDGFIRTGDLAKLDEQGMMTIVDRKKNVLILAGRTVSPKELEEVVEGLDGVRAVMAVGLRVEVGGEEVHLVVESKSSEVEALQRLVARELRRQMAIAVAAVHVVPPGGIPRTYNGKFQYGVMRERLVTQTLS